MMSSQREHCDVWREKMKVTYIHHSSFLVETDENYFLFDYFEGELPEFKEDKPLLVFASHRHGDHFHR